MGQFTLALHDNKFVDVRWGTIRKKTYFLGLFRKKNVPGEIQRGYIVTIEPGSNEQRQYRLLKNRQGCWISKQDGGFLTTNDDATSLEIKIAIDDYESQIKDNS